MFVAVSAEHPLSHIFRSSLSHRWWYAYGISFVTRIPCCDFLLLYSCPLRQRRTVEIVVVLWMMYVSPWLSTLPTHWLCTLRRYMCRMYVSPWLSTCPTYWLCTLRRYMCRQTTVIAYLYSRGHSHTFLFIVLCTVRLIIVIPVLFHWPLHCCHSCLLHCYMCTSLQLIGSSLHL